MTDLILHINRSLTDSPLLTTGVEWVEVDSIYDSFIMSNGGVGVTDGATIPTEDILNRNAVQLNNISPVTVPKYFLADNSAGILKELKLAGNQQKRHVFACAFDGATATEPQLEAWDNQTMDTYQDPSLGSGIPSSSWYKAICTTTNTPALNWTGVSLAGNGASNVVYLNDGNGVLTGADVLYFQFKIVIPGGYVTPAIHTPMLVVVYATN
jgi:hypothetical protein